MTTRPNFFIIGAPKCGTTGMSEYLRSHPQVFLSDPKELHYFDTDIRPTPTRGALSEYLCHFANAKDCHLRIGEASPSYLRSEVTHSQIAKHFPEAKIVVMIRNPVDLVYAFHGEMYKWGMETTESFEAAWYLQDARRCGDKIPSRCRYPTMLQYELVGRLGKQVQAVSQLFPMSQIHFIRFEEFTRDPLREYIRLLHFLDLPYDGRREFPKVNQATTYRIKWIGQYPKQLREQLSRPISLFRKATGFKGTGILRALDEFNALPISRPALRPEFRNHLRNIYYQDIGLLQQLTKLDLTDWLADTKSDNNE